jgi:hypothetical protein
MARNRTKSKENVKRGNKKAKGNRRGNRSVMGERRKGERKDTKAIDRL